jgi:Na+-translocating ferredoxin:NAD+ oxidoreductase RnfG subunit
MGLFRHTKQLTAFILILSGILTSAAASPEIMRKEKGGVVIINTTALCSGVKGFAGPTPVEITIKKGKVQSVKPLANNETPKYFMRLSNENLWNKWNGLTPKQASVKDIDAVTGATYSSRAVIQNVREGMKYMLNNK